MQKFWQKGGYSPFWILVSRGQKKPKRASKGSHEGNKNSAFWMELNMTLKILAFCIPSFQSSWHFTVCIFLELNTPEIKANFTICLLVGTRLYAELHVSGSVYINVPLGHVRQLSELWWVSLKSEKFRKIRGFSLKTAMFMPLRRASF